MKIAIVNQPLGNRGDESAHRAFVLSILSNLKDAEIDVIFINEKSERIDAFVVDSDKVRYINIVGLRNALNYSIKKTVAHENLLLTFLHPVLRKYYNIIKEYDYVVCAPGGICMGGFMNWSHVWKLYVAMRLHKKVIYWGRSIGPFTDEDKNHRVFKRVSYKLINYFEYISLRDEESYQLANDIRPNCEKTVDSAFLSEITIEAPEIINNTVISDQYVVFVPNELIWHYKYRDVSEERITKLYLKIIELIETVHSNIQIVMLPQTYKSMIKDYDYFLKLRDISEYKDSIVVLDENQSSDIQQAIIKKAKFVVGARYHSIIFAINNSVPFLSLSYEHKMRGILKILNLNDRQFDIEDFLISMKDIDNEVCAILKKKIQDNSSIAAQSEYARSIVNNAFDGMVEVLKR